MVSRIGSICYTAGVVLDACLLSVGMISNKLSRILSVSIVYLMALLPVDKIGHP
jgi:hypothetical protein